MKNSCPLLLCDCRMSELVDSPKYDKTTGIKTSTFYNQNKLNVFPKLVKTRVQSTNVNRKPNQTNSSRYTKRSYNKRSQINKRETLPMFGKGTSKRKLYKTNGRNTKSKTILISDVEKFASCEVNNKTDLQMGKRSLVKMREEDGEQLRMRKKIKLDMNKNIESNEKFSTQNNVSISENFEIKLDLEKEVSKTEEFYSENRLNVDDNVLIHNQGEPSNMMGFGISSSSSGSGDSLEGIEQNNGSSTIKDNVLVTDQKEPSKTIKDPSYDILGFGNLSSQNKHSSKETVQNSRTSRKKMGSLDAFFSVENTRTAKNEEKLKDSKTKKKLEDSGFVESFRILDEFSSQEQGNYSSMDTSPLLFSQSSSGSSKSKSVSPDSQSSITKYFTPLSKSTSITALKNSTVSPTSDKKGKRIVKGRKVTSPSVSPVANKKEQMFLDLGQKNFGHTTCPTCNMVYTSAQPEDEAYHVKFHQKVVTGLRFLGWKTERVVEHFDDGRVIVVLPQDPPSHLKKVSSVRTVVDDELGFSSETSLRMQVSKTYLFIADKKVVGCVVAVGIQEAFPLLPCTTNGDKSERSEQGAWCCSSSPARAQCGISRVWVLQQYRRKRIASRILDCVRNDFMFGGVVSKELLAFSDPTPLGKQLAESYCGTENFLVFR